ncbi:hypothetical protein [Amycolatopsis eburnea]|uniref:hypothetical protein n=1 Tax=Amycolatopsis eburnea TaxID=2267691 RepID=UPI001315A4C7|nr:hypothetical protein [Amycolatopsis eburnea]
MIAFRGEDDMIKRMVAGVLAAVLAFGAVAAPEASAADKPRTGCVWIWTAGVPTCQLQ